MKTRALVILCILASAAFAQFQNLATTDDGSVLLFSTKLITPGSNQPAWEKLFRIDASGLSLYAERDRTASYGDVVTNHYRLMGAELSGDGRIVSVIAQADCNRVGSYCFVQVPKIQTEISGLAGKPTLVLDGQGSVSRNGRYAVLCCDGSADAPTMLYDLASNASQKLSGYAYVTLAVSSTGVAVAGSSYGGLLVASFTESHTITTVAKTLQVAVDDAGASAVYAGTAADGWTLLSRVELQSGNETPLIEAANLSLVGVSNAGDRIAFLKDAQLFTIAPDGKDLRQLTQDAAGISQAVLAGGGTVAYAVTFAGRILRFDLPAGTATELVGQTVTLQIPSSGGTSDPIAGSAFCVGGTGLAASTFSATPPLPGILGGLQLLLDGQPVPMASVTPAHACFQVPWETATGPHALIASAPSDPRFTGGASGTLEIAWAALPTFVRLPAGFPESLPLAVHQGGRRIVTPGDPASPGETLTFFLTGLGPVSPPVPDGAAAPANPPSVVVNQPACGLENFTPDDSRSPVQVRSAVMEPGVVGYYQLVVQLPEQVPVSNGQAVLFCSIGPPYAGDGVSLPIAQQPPHAGKKR